MLRELKCPTQIHKIIQNESGARKLAVAPGSLGGSQDIYLHCVMSSYITNENLQVYTFPPRLVAEPKFK